ncbi:MAG: S-adenosylmethionine decarboxylase [Candidatus Rokubacteria bacterium]|nr:S-adenosylmethionine decarboxylase [Candidatus Rokubacteria bacterium]
MADAAKDDFVGRHLIVDASTYTRRNLASTDTVFALFEALNRNLDMTAVLPPIVCRYPFANDEIASFCDDIEAELAAKAKELTATAREPVDLSLTPVRVMREFLRRRQMEESGVTGVSIWAESHAAIHTWDEDNYFAFDAFSCKDFLPRDALRLLLTHFDVDMLNCVNLFRFQRSIPIVSNFQVNANWEVLVEGHVIGELESVDLSGNRGAAPAAEPRWLVEASGSAGPAGKGAGSRTRKAAGSRKPAGTSNRRRPAAPRGAP